MKVGIYIWSDDDFVYCRPVLPPPYGMLPLHKTEVEIGEITIGEFGKFTGPYFTADEVGEHLSDYFGVPVFDLGSIKNVDPRWFEFLKGPPLDLLGCINGAEMVEPISFDSLELAREEALAALAAREREGQR